MEWGRIMMDKPAVRLYHVGLKKVNNPGSDCGKIQLFGSAQ